MKWVLAFVLVALSGLASAWYNQATPAMLDARYDLAACNVDFGKEFLSMREECGIEENVTVFDSSDYVDTLDGDLADLREAADDADEPEFGAASFKLGLDSLALIGAIVGDAFRNKTLGFFACVDENDEPLKSMRDECVAAALDKEKVAAKEYVNNELEKGNEEIEDLQDLGADTSGMEQNIEYGEELVDDADAVYDTHDTKEIEKLHLRHSRLMLLFRAEQMKAVIDYARPIIEEGNNGNREEILERGDELEEDIDDLLEECEYSAGVENNAEYSRQNLGCWTDGLVIANDFNSIRALILEGMFE
ncbi:hypothetical protein H0O02_02165 [Candidatus Micrarchaeota archaeon]|nr:hypothetical protein [Candidatus Micrarchaeota archaeon]